MAVNKRDVEKFLQQDGRDVTYRIHEIQSAELDAATALLDQLYQGELAPPKSVVDLKTIGGEFIESVPFVEIVSGHEPLTHDEWHKGKLDPRLIMYRDKCSCVASWLRSVLVYAEQTRGEKLFWRIEPEMQQWTRDPDDLQEGMYRIYARLVIV